MNKLRYLLVPLGIVLTALTVGYIFQFPWAISTWPWPDGPLSHLFVGSILASITVAVFWIAFAGEWGAMAAGALNVLVMFAAMAIYLSWLYVQGDHPSLLPYIVMALVAGLFSGGLFLWSRHIPIRDSRLTPYPVRISFVIFAATLILVSTALILKAPGIFPWLLNPDSSVMFGCIFLGDAFYFIVALLNPRWNNARSQLLSFLAYDLVLIGPFLGQFAVVKPDHRLSLIIYVLVLLYSGGLAIYYLFLNKTTRRWAIDPSDQRTNIPGHPAPIRSHSEDSWRAQ